MSRTTLPRKRKADESAILSAYVAAKAVHDYKALKELGVDAGKLVREAVERVISEAMIEVAKESA